MELVFDIIKKRAVAKLTDFKKRLYKEKGLKAILFLGIIYFGFMFPDSLGDHDKMVHFAAHFGMSFLISCFIYAFSRLKLNLKKSSSYFLVVGITLIAGSIYKWMELISQGRLSSFQVSKLFEVSGFYTSMSQNISGIFASLLLITYFFGKWNSISSLAFVEGVNGNNRSVGVNYRRNLV
jgi:hypothetical protein